MGKDQAKAELTKLVQKVKPLGKTTRDIPTRHLVSIAQKYCLGGAEVLELLDEVWTAA